MSTLQSMPYDPLSMIISKVGAVSSTAYCNAIIACKSLYLVTSKLSLVSTDFCLSPIVKKPHLALQYKALLDRCLAINNLDAHYYIRGLVSYFKEKDNSWASTTWKSHLIV
ncbi:hypothetical protein Bca4012_085401 [Brassica carinata]